MLTFQCVPPTLDELGGFTAIVPSGKFLVVYDQEGNCKVLEAPAVPSVFYFNGASMAFSDGTADRPLALPFMQQSSAEKSHIVGIGPDGTMFRFVGEGPDQVYLTWSPGGGMRFDKIATIGIPDTGSGILKRVPYVDGDPVPPPVLFDDPGVLFIKSDGDVDATDPGVNGQLLTLVNQIPTWVNPASGALAAGTAATGLAGVVATNTSNSVVRVEAANMTLSDSTGATSYAIGVNVTADLGAPVGLGGLDTGAETANKWYYFYVVSNGTIVSSILSENGDAPDMTSAPTYTFFALASVFRNDGGSNIVHFMQRGRSFWTGNIVMSDPVAILTAGFNAITQGVPLTTIVPPNVKTVTGIIGGSDAANEGTNLFTEMAADATGLAMQFIPYHDNQPAREGFVMNYGSFHRLPILDPVSPAMYWKGGAGSTKRRVVINGYEI